MFYFVLIVGLVGVFFCDYTATSWSYTYLHSLSLHDSPPILVDLGSRVRRVSRFVIKSFPPPTLSFTRAPPNIRPMPGRGLIRTEEHTYELQSLLSIYYTVFCLKKKKQISNTTFEARPKHITPILNHKIISLYKQI